MKGRLSDSRNDRPRMATDGHGWPRMATGSAVGCHENSSNMVKKWRFNWFKYFKYQKWWTHGELKLILPPKILRHWICQENEDEIQPYLYYSFFSMVQLPERWRDMGTSWNNIKPWCVDLELWVEHATKRRCPVHSQIAHVEDLVLDLIGISKLPMIRGYTSTYTIIVLPFYHVLP